MQQALAHYIDTARFRCRSVIETRELAGVLAACFPEPERVLRGIYELLLNAVEHGNLGIGYEFKGHLIAEQGWEAEIARRETLPENQVKFVDVVLQKKPDGVFLQITDMGQGFDPRPYLRVDPSRAIQRNGRGIAQAAAQSFDELKFNSKGNQVLVMVASSGHAPALDW